MIDVNAYMGVSLLALAQLMILGMSALTRDVTLILSVLVIAMATLAYHFLYEPLFYMGTDFWYTGWIAVDVVGIFLISAKQKFFDSGMIWLDTALILLLSNHVAFNALRYLDRIVGTNALRDVYLVSISTIERLMLVVCFVVVVKTLFARNEKIWKIAP